MSGINTESTPNDNDINNIVLFWYHASPFGRRVKAYLTLRNIHHAECIVPPILPRPVQTDLGIQYRRSPVMAIGRDVYLDTRLMISRLEELFPATSQHPGLSSDETHGLAALLQKLMVDVSVFREVVKQIPGDSALAKDVKFRKDRAGFFGAEWKPDSGSRAEGIVHTREVFAILESLLQDGRQWIAGTGKISLADHKVHAWRSRYRHALEDARNKAPKAVRFQNADAVRYITSAEFTDKDLVVDPKDPTQLSVDTTVELYPTDGGGFTHQDHGRLVKLTPSEAAIIVQADNGTDIRLHAPRWRFKIKADRKAKI